MGTLTYFVSSSTKSIVEMKIGFKRHIVIQEKSAKMRYLPRSMWPQPGTNE